MANYHKIWIKHKGPIPKDEEGRTYDIHHNDGVRANNDINNLQCVSIQEHFDIHNKQKDVGACHALAIRMEKSHDEISKLAHQAQKKRMEEGTHNFLTLEFQEIKRKSNEKRIKDGTHNFLSSDFQKNVQNKMIENGTHHFLNSEFKKRNKEKCIKFNKERIENGTHHFLNPEFQKNTVKKLMAEGRHNTQIIYTCPNCQKTGKGPSFIRYHFNKCISLSQFSC